MQGYTDLVVGLLYAAVCLFLEGVEGGPGEGEDRLLALAIFRELSESCRFRRPAISKPCNVLIKPSQKIDL